MSDLNGAWDFTVKTPMKEEHSKITLNSEGGTLTGKMESEEHGVQELENGTINGNELYWETKVTKPMKLTLKYNATIDDDQKIEGIVKVAVAKMKFWGTPAA